jgi:hypothetical protein
MPAQLKELMRHESIETTLRFYVGTDAQAKADAAWAAFEASRPKNLEASGNNFAHSAVGVERGVRVRVWRAWPVGGSQARSGEHFVTG